MLKKLFLFFFLLAVSTASFAAEVRLENNLYSNWVRLAVSGREQAEIEYYLRNYEKKSIERVKERLRLAIMQRLHYLQIGERLQESSDIDDIAVVVDRIYTEIRYLGMEEDTEIRYRIKENFNINISTNILSSPF